MALTDTQDEGNPRVPEWTLGERLAKARRDAHLEQEDMARIFDCSSSTISNWENDLAQPRKMLAVIARWAAETRVPLVWLLSGPEGARSRCSDVIDLRVLPGEGKSHETVGQVPLPFLMLLEA